MTKIWFHADDYGITTKQSETILLCHEQGCLNSMSVIPNSVHKEAVFAQLQQRDPNQQLRRIVHLNFVEGKSMAKASQIPMLVDEKGMFCCSFMKIFFWNYVLHGEKKKALKAQLKQEIMAQIDALTQKNEDFHITGIDSHQHYHMIPVVFDALMEVLAQREALPVTFIRIPVDPMMPLLSTPAVWREFRCINFVKWCILKLNSGRIRKTLQANNIQAPVFFGIFFTCEMKEQVVKALLPKYLRIAQKKKQSLELMFHPGALLSREELLDPKSEELYEFYLSENRQLEKECLLSGIENV